MLSDSGAGGSHLSSARPRRVRRRPPGALATTAHFVDELVEATNDRALSQVVTRSARLDLLYLDELGYVHIEPRARGCSCRIVATSARNTPPSRVRPTCSREWRSVFPETRLVAAHRRAHGFNDRILESARFPHLRHHKTQNPSPLSPQIRPSIAGADRARELTKPTPGFVAGS